MRCHCQQNIVSSTCPHVSIKPELMEKAERVWMEGVSEKKQFRTNMYLDTCGQSIRDIVGGCARNPTNQNQALCGSFSLVTPLFDICFLICYMECSQIPVLSALSLGNVA